jgi:GH35 family endo-1,4-beta-xylanase
VYSQERVIAYPMQDFVRIAFEAVKAIDPTAKLFINDFKLENPVKAKGRPSI